MTKLIAHAVWQETGELHYVVVLVWPMFFFQNDDGVTTARLKSVPLESCCRVIARTRLVSVVSEKKFIFTIVTVHWIPLHNLLSPTLPPLLWSRSTNICILPKNICDTAMLVVFVCFILLINHNLNYNVSSRWLVLVLLRWSHFHGEQEVVDVERDEKLRGRNRGETEFVKFNFAAWTMNIT